jgi:hypothetical protein
MEQAVKHRRIGCLISLGVMLVLGVAFVWWFFFSEFMAIDRCLDSGGRWGDDGSCQFETAPE